MRIMRVVCLLLFLSLLIDAKEFRIGYYSKSLSDLSKQDLVIATNVYIQEIAQEIDTEVQSTFYDNSQEMCKDLAKGKLEFLSAPGLDFVKYADTKYLSNGFMEGYLDGSKETFIVLVSKNSEIKSIADLYDKQIAIQESDELIRLYFENEFLKKSLQMKVTYIPSATRQRAMLKLFFGKVDAAVITNKSFELFAELNPQIRKKLKLLKETTLVATNFGFLSNHVSKKERLYYNNMAKNLRSTVRGKQLLALYKTEILVDAKVEELEPIRAIYTENIQLKKRKK